MQEYLRCDSSSKLKLAAGGAKPKTKEGVQTPTSVQTSYG